MSKELFVHINYPVKLAERSDARQGLSYTVLAQVKNLLRHRYAFDLPFAGIFDQELGDILVQENGLEDADSSAVAGAMALMTADRFPKNDRRGYFRRC